MRYLLLLIFPLLIVYTGHTAIDPKYGWRQECELRGYTVDGDSCVFPDSSKCLLKDFHDGVCGSEFKTADYCVPEGNYVWDGPCCEGLEPYLPEGHAGQATCQPINKVRMKKAASSWWMFALLGFVTVILIVIARRRARKRKNTE